jgi:hypothetical protein
MSLLSSLASGALSVLRIFASKSTVVSAVDGVAITAGSVESSLGTVGGFVSAFSAAWKAKNYEAEAELTIDEALTVASDLGAPYAGLGAAILPVFGRSSTKGSQTSICRRLCPMARVGSSPSHGPTIRASSSISMGRSNIDRQLSGNFG